MQRCERELGTAQVCNSLGCCVRRLAAWIARVGSSSIQKSSLGRLQSNPGHCCTSFGWGRAGPGMGTCFDIRCHDICLDFFAIQIPSLVRILDKVVPAGRKGGLAQNSTVCASADAKLVLSRQKERETRHVTTKFTVQAVLQCSHTRCATLLHSVSTMPGAIAGLKLQIGYGVSTAEMGWVIRNQMTSVRAPAASGYLLKCQPLLSMKSARKASPSRALLDTVLLLAACEGTSVQLAAL
ncbi:hypothetical protein V8C86DRAFT_1158730 [Haematococcus lacustris]